jgi:hypothetical protein
MHVGLVASSPTAAVNPDDDREILALGRGVNIKHLPFVLRLGVGNALVNLRLAGDERGGNEENEEKGNCTHGWLQLVLVYST